MSTQRISETLVGDGNRVACRACGHALARAGTAWKPHASLTTVRVKDLPGASCATNALLVLRRFSCPSCGSLLDTETALPDDPFLNDVVAM
ncbi:hypothetical protein PTE30175_01488 [Pandoraea terrae]|uniref:Uncharacterized protein n=1 Tax=Pandoraea terrae TaxID=1537710 RepID=A0A5E4TPH3_9BURK|nr:hypothetical protein PTE30175_01488 [Pandoraea terrae]